jgi:hypothetical protein
VASLREGSHYRPSAQRNYQSDRNDQEISDEEDRCPKERFKRLGWDKWVNTTEIGDRQQTTVISFSVQCGLLYPWLVTLEARGRLLLAEFHLYLKHHYGSVITKTRLEI